jgi:hypothetical protein
MRGAALAAVLLTAAIWLRAHFQTPFEILNSTYWQPLIPPLPGQFLSAYLVPQLLLILAALSWPGGFSRAADRLLLWLQPVWLCPLLVFLVALTFRHFGLMDTQYVSDEVCFNFHALCLAGGSLGCPPPPYPDHFQFSGFFLSPKIWTGVSSPGWPALLALGYLLHCPLLVAPLLGGLSTLLLQFLARRWYGREAAALTGLMLLASPMLLLNASTDYSHLATLFWSAATIASLERVDQPTGRRGWAFLGGLCLGMLLSTRQLDALLVLVALLAWRLVNPRQSTRPGLVQVLLVGVGVLPTAMLQFMQNYVVSGNPLLAAYAITNESTNQFTATLGERLVLFGYIYARAAVWMFPGFLECLPRLRKGRGWFGLVLLGGYALGYSMPGAVEIGSRYVLNACALLLPLLAGPIYRSRLGKSCILPSVLLCLLAVYPGEAGSVVKHYRTQWAMDQWLGQAFPARCILFYRRLTPDVLGVARNYPNLPGRIRALSLDPEENLALRRHFSSIPAFYMDWIPGQGYQITPFEEPHDLNMDRICAGMIYANLRNTQEKALEQWARVPADSPYFEAARQNRIKLLRKLGRSAEAERL